MLRHHVGTQRRFSYCSKPERLCPLSPSRQAPLSQEDPLLEGHLAALDSALSIFKDRPAIGQRDARRAAGWRLRIV
jgi:hypothetical protein